jgi:hypothetical protein
MVPRSVAHSESIAPFIAELERLIAEAMDEWKIPGLAITVCRTGRWRSSAPMAFAMSKPAHTNCTGPRFAQSICEPPVNRLIGEHQ